MWFTSKKGEYLTQSEWELQWFFNHEYNEVTKPVWALTSTNSTLTNILGNRITKNQIIFNSLALDHESNKLAKQIKIKRKWQ